MSEETKRKVPHLFTSIHDLTTGLRKPAWLNSPEISKFLQSDFANYQTYFNTLGSDLNFKKDFTKFTNQVNGLENPNETF
jgi:hypothetical protein